MDKFYLLICCSILFCNIVTALKCHTGNKEDNQQYYRIMENCRKRYMRDDGNSDANSDESTSSNEDNFDRRMMSTGGYNSDFGRSGMNGNRNQNNHRSRDWMNGRSSSDYNRNTSRMNGMYGASGRDNDNQRSRSNRRNMNNNWRFYNGGNFDQRYDDQFSGYDNQDQSVDQRGFPDRSAVNEIMLEDIQDPELRDFVEEAIMQCFHYVNLEGKQSKCRYSQNLLTCLIEKGEERCEDWNSRYKR